jgi:hypothetical protein
MKKCDDKFTRYLLYNKWKYSRNLNYLVLFFNISLGLIEGLIPTLYVIN